MAGPVAHAPPPRRTPGRITALLAAAAAVLASLILVAPGVSAITGTVTFIPNDDCTAYPNNFLDIGGGRVGYSWVHFISSSDRVLRWTFTLPDGVTTDQTVDLHERLQSGCQDANTGTGGNDGLHTVVRRIPGGTSLVRIGNIEASDSVLVQTSPDMGLTWIPTTTQPTCGWRADLSVVDSDSWTIACLTTSCGGGNKITLQRTDNAGTTWDTNQDCIAASGSYGSVNSDFQVRGDVVIDSSGVAANARRCFFDTALNTNTCENIKLSGQTNRLAYTVSIGSIEYIMAGQDGTVVGTKDLALFQYNGAATTYVRRLTVGENLDLNTLGYRHMETDGVYLYISYIDDETTQRVWVRYNPATDISATLTFGSPGIGNPRDLHGFVANNTFRFTANDYENSAAVGNRGIYSVSEFDVTGDDAFQSTSWCSDSAILDYNGDGPDGTGDDDFGFNYAEGVTFEEITNLDDTLDAGDGDSHGYKFESTSDDFSYLGKGWESPGTTHLKTIFRIEAGTEGATTTFRISYILGDFTTPSNSAKGNGHSTGVFLHHIEAKFVEDGDHWRAVIHYRNGATAGDVGATVNIRVNPNNVHTFAFILDTTGDGYAQLVDEEAGTPIMTQPLATSGLPSYATYAGDSIASAWFIAQGSNAILFGDTFTFLDDNDDGNDESTCMNFTPGVVMTGSQGTTPIADRPADEDIDNDDVPNSEDPDSDGDGLCDNDDPEFSLPPDTPGAEDGCVGGDLDDDNDLILDGDDSTPGGAGTGTGGSSSSTGTSSGRICLFCEGDDASVLGNSGSRVMRGFTLAILMTIGGLTVGAGGGAAVGNQFGRIGTGAAAGGALVGALMLAISLVMAYQFGWLEWWHILFITLVVLVVGALLLAFGRR
jgi:hypothetical protein